MKFSCEIEGIHLSIEAIKEEFKPTSMDIMGDDSYASELDESMGFFAIFLTSKKGDLELKHYLPGQILCEDPDEMQADIECILDEDGIMESLLEKWELIACDDSKSPPWSES